MNVHRSTAERQAAAELAKATATRSQNIVRTLGQITEKPLIANALFAVLETQALVASNGLEVSVPAPGVPLMVGLGGSTPPLRQT